MASPKKYYLHTNPHGNLSRFPKDKKWVRFTRADINRHKPSHRYALQSGRIFTYEVCDGFAGSNRRGWSPILVPIIHCDQLPLFHRLVGQYEKQKAAQKKTQDRERERLKKTPEYQARQEEMRARQKANRDRQKTRIERLNAICEDCKMPTGPVGRMLSGNLRDMREAHPDWLRDAYCALEGSLEGGVMRDWKLGRTDLGFYQALQLAIGAYRRHEYTNYDALMDSGYEKWEARVCAEQKNNADTA